MALIWRVDLEPLGEGEDSRVEADAVDVRAQILVEIDGRLSKGPLEHRVWLATLRDAGRIAIDGPGAFGRHGHQEMRQRPYLGVEDRLTVTLVVPRRQLRHGDQL